MEYSLLSAFVMFLLITDPLGNIPLFVTSLKKIEKEKHTKIIVREHIIAYCVLILFMFAGEKLLNSLGLSNASLQIAGSIVLFIISINMIFPNITGVEHKEEITEPLIVPLAIPAIAGPSLMATVILLTTQKPGQMLDWVIALTLAIVISCGVLLLANKIQEKIDKRALTAMEKLMGLILVSLSVEMMIKGIKSIH